MTSNPIPPLPVGDDDDRVEADADTLEADADAIIDDEDILDPDANDDLIDSAEADRRAAGGDYEP